MNKQTPTTFLPTVNSGIKKKLKTICESKTGRKRHKTLPEKMSFELRTKRFPSVGRESHAERQKSPGKGFGRRD